MVALAAKLIRSFSFFHTMRRMLHLSQSLLLFLGILILAEGFQRGGPISLCNDPYPHHHGHYRSVDATPYQISLSANQYNPGDTITVTISSPVNTDFKGFQVGAHSTDGLWETLYGEFTKVPTGATPFKYYSDVENCVTHGAKFEPAAMVELEWLAPNVSVGDLVFTATVLKDFEHFWVNHSVVLKSAQPAAASAVEPPMPMGGTFDSDLDISQCGKSSGCVTYPNDCTVHCDFAVSYKTVGDGIRFRVTNKRAPITASYSALGISSDHMMPDDETFTCMDVGGSLDFAHGYNPSMHNVKVKSVNQVSDIVIQSVDGALSCEFTRKTIGSFQYFGQKGPITKEFDYTSGLDTAEYHLYLSFGDPYPGSKQGVEKHHELPPVSQAKVAFNKAEQSNFYTLHNTVKVHVTFMVVAWFGAAAISMIVSRYYKDGFVNSSTTLYGLKPWFQVHRGLAFVTAILTAVGFVIILVHYSGLNDAQLLHGGFGIAVMVLTVLQVIAGMCRPDPDSGKKRIIFNWIHRISGALSYILAAVTMFIGSNIGYMTETMKTTGTGLLAGLVSLQIVTAIILEISSACSGDQEKVEDSNVDGSTMKIEEPKNQTSTAKHTKSMALFILYITLLISLLVCFLVMVWLF